MRHSLFSKIALLLSLGAQWNVARSLLVVAAWLLAALLSAPTAFAVTRYVSPTGKDVIITGGQAFPNDCSDTNPCESINGTIQIAQPGDTIHVIEGRYKENVTVSKNVTIEGEGIDLLFAGPVGTFVDGNKQGSVFDIQSGVSATIKSMTIANGITGITNAGNNLDVENVAINFNGVEGSSVGGFGIDNNGKLSLTRVSLIWNRVGLRNSGTVNTMNESFAAFNVEDGIRNEAGGKLDVSNSLICNNQALGVVNYGDLTMLNVTIGGNWIRGLEAYANASLNYVTITANGVGSKISGMGLSTTGILTNGGSITFANSLVYGNGPAGYKQCANVGQAANKDGDYNVISDDSCIAPSKMGKSILDNPDPNPGAVWTYDPVAKTAIYPLVQGSPAIDRVPNNGCVTRDQRGVTRPIDGNKDGILACDAGAYEYP